jgi:hypothetical protein
MSPGIAALPAPSWRTRLSVIDIDIDIERDKDLYSGLIRLHILHHALAARLGEKGIPGSRIEQDGRQRRRIYRATPRGRMVFLAAKEKVRERFGELLEGE